MKKIVFLLLASPLHLIAQKTLTAQIDQLMRMQKDFSGVVLVADQSKSFFHKAYGYRDFANKIKLKKTDIFELASLSKQFTSMIIMMLKEKALLDYDHPVEKYLDIPYKGITIRHLLTHTSGLPDYQEIMDKYWDKTRVAGNQDILQYLNKYAPPSLFEPGTKYSYSNTGYVLLASIAEKASGKDFITMCREWIFEPLKMKSTDIRTLQQRSKTKNFARGHIYLKEEERFVRADSFPSSDYTIWLGNRKGPGRVSSAAKDLLKWDKALHTERLVKKTTKDEAFSPMKLRDGSTTQYGFGWILRSDSALGKIVHHSGDNPGYKTHILRYLDTGKTLIVLSNAVSAENNFEKLLEEIETIIRTNIRYQ